MILKSLSLTNFRNYSKADFSFSPTTTLILGPNAAGKTNILEAVYYLATGKSFRAGHDREAIRNGEGFVRIEGIKGVKEGNDGGLEITILANENGENTSSKRFKVNGVKKRRADFSGNLRAVYFGPEQIQLVTGSPSRRRKYLDSVLVQVDRDYARALSEYEKVVRQRNRLLVLIREGGIKGLKGVNGQMEYWDERLVALGSSLTSGRGRFFETINNQLSIDSKNRRLDRTIGNLFLDYQPRTVDRVFLEKNRDREIAAGMTLYGPHRDDFKFTKGSSENSENSVSQKIRAPENQKIRNSDALTPRRTEAPSYSEFSDLSSFGSRGEQRLAVLHLKLAELEFITERAGDRPILLLDDIFSELDEDNRGQVLKLFGQQQTIITTTDIDQINGEKLSQHTPKQNKFATGLEVLQLQRC